MAERSRLPHLVVAGTAQAEPYGVPQQGGGEPRQPPPRNRSDHGTRLRAQLEQAWGEAQQSEERQAAVSVGTQHGVYLEFESDPGFELAFKSLEFTPSGILLLSVREEQRITYATVYVPDGKLRRFFNLVDAYLNRDKETASGKPRNQSLIDSISSIRRAAIRSFWTDDPSLFPDSNQLVWWEVWLRNTIDASRNFADFCQQSNISMSPNKIQFIDRLVVLVYGTREQLSASVDVLDCIAELRLAKQVATFYVDIDARQQAIVIDSLIQRTTFPSNDAPAVCLLDTGVSRGHPLIAPVLDQDDMHAYDPAWGAEDQSGHGTEMAGLSIFGDLVPVLASNEPVVLEHRLESVKILPPVGDNDPKLYGEIIREAIARAEVQAPNRLRAVCLTASTTDFRDRGQPSSWSAALDDISSGSLDDHRRLIIVSAGNTDKNFRRDYPTSNDTDGVHDPGQSWNALTVGAYTEKTDIFHPDFNGWRPIAPPGDLSPASTTSVIWETSWPLKPEIVMEGGNNAIDPNDTNVDSLEDLSLLTTRNPNLGSLLSATGDTSASASLAARMAAIIQARYPQFWPETVRALMVHSAKWTPAMLNRLPLNRSRQDIERRLLRRYGFGVPDLDSALWSASDALTLVVQNELRPYDRDRMNEMHLHQLPWPTGALQDLAETEVELRVTLSYFIEPSPGRRGWKYRHRYASHGLRFDMKTAEESVEEFRRRINRLAREESKSSLTGSGSSEWFLGPELRHKGSLHSDIWQGTGAALAQRNVVAVCPVIGWWRERHQLGRWDRPARYALVISIRSPRTDIDIYTPVAAQIGVVTLI